MSRGAELLRLGSKNAEIKRNTSEDASKNVTLKSGGASTGDFEIEKESLKLKYQNEVDEALKTKDEQKICLKLMELQVSPFMVYFMSQILMGVLVCFSSLITFIKLGIVTPKALLWRK